MLACGDMPPEQAFGCRTRKPVAARTAVVEHEGEAFVEREIARGHDIPHLLEHFQPHALRMLGFAGSGRPMSVRNTPEARSKSTK